MTATILVDTDVMIDYLRGHPKAVSFLKRQTGPMLLSSVVVAELYAGVKGEAEQTTIDDLVSLFRIVPVCAEIAKAAGLLRRDFAGSYGVGLADAIIAATALAENAKLKTLNARHFPMLPGLKPAYVKK